MSHHGQVRPAKEFSTAIAAPTEDFHTPETLEEAAFEALDGGQSPKVGRGRGRSPTQPSQKATLAGEKLYATIDAP